MQQEKAYIPHTWYKNSIVTKKALKIPKEAHCALSVYKVQIVLKMYTFLFKSKFGKAVIVLSNKATFWGIQKAVADKTQFMQRILSHFPEG